MGGPGAAGIFLTQFVASVISLHQNDELEVGSSTHAGRSAPQIRRELKMSAVAVDKNALVQVLLDEASDADLMFYLARADGLHALKDLLECIRDAEQLSIEDLWYNIGVVRKKKRDARMCPMNRVFRRLMGSDAVPVVESIASDNPRISSSLH
jgi:hypothetical protein